MREDCGFWFPTDGMNSLSSLALSRFEKHDPNLTSKTSGTTNMFSPVSTQLSKSHLDGSRGWVHGPFHSHQFLPPQKPCMMKMPLASFLRNQVYGVIYNPEGECTQKRLLVFDQSGDQTTLLLTSNIQKSSESLKKPDMKEDLLRSKKDLAICQEMKGISEPDLQREKQEDTEELNALLYSEDESDCYYSDEDEVTSSGHSPSTILAHGDQETFVESHAKKRKVLESCVNGYNSAAAPFRRTSNENMLDAESSCGFLKRSKTSTNKIEEEIFETVSLLRSIVPVEDLMDPILVIDRAIDYLQSLKMEAKN